MEEEKQEKVSEENAVYFEEDGGAFIRGTITVDQYLEVRASYCFRPSGNMLLTEFLMKKLKNLPLSTVQIPEEPNLFSIHPEDLAKNHHLREGRQPMFFYTRRKRGNEEDEISEKVDGFWKILEADLPVKRKKKDGQIINVGFKNRLEFSGNQRTQTQWRMNEFRLHQKEEESRITEVDQWVVCRIYMSRSRDDEEAWDEKWYFSSDDEAVNDW